MDNIDLLRNIVENNPRHFIAIIKSKKNAALLQWIDSETPKNIETLISKIYYLLNSDKQQSLVCKNGKTRHVLHISDDDWLFCGKVGVCECFQNYRKEKNKQTCLEKYGSENPNQVKEFKDKIKQTNNERYGTDYGFQANIVKDKIKESCLEKYGVENVSQSANIKDKKKARALKNYGVEHPAQSDLIKEKTKNSNFEKYGVEYPTQLDSVKSQIQKTTLERYGVESHYQVHINTDVYDIWIDPAKFALYLKSNDIRKMCSTFNTTISTIRYKSKNYGCYELYLKQIHSSSSTYEEEISKFLDENEISYLRNKRTIISPQEIDIYIPDHNLAIEFNGIYWHSEVSGEKSKNYHKLKTEKCNEKGIQLLHIFEDEWIQNKDIVKSIILHKCGITNERHYARKLQIQEVKNKDTAFFLNENHIQGFTKASVNLVLIDKTNDIKAAMTFSKSRYDKSDSWEIVRYATKGSVVGGASKLLNHFIKKYKPSRIVSYCDLRYGNGIMYEKLGFALDSITNPGYFYTDYNERYNRIQFQKHKLAKEGYDPNKTEWQIMQERGYDRIWDCGHKKYVLNIT
jgi:hypothetical protein